MPQGMNTNKFIAKLVEQASSGSCDTYGLETPCRSGPSDSCGDDNGGYSDAVVNGFWREGQPDDNEGTVKWHLACL